MFRDLIEIGANMMFYGVSTDPDQMRGMNAEQMAAYQRLQGDMRNAPWPSLREMRGMMNSLRHWSIPTPKPTMTLAEWDARRKAFRP